MPPSMETRNAWPSKDNKAEGPRDPAQASPGAARATSTATASATSRTGTPPAGDPSSTPTQVPAASRPLRFVLSQAMEPGKKARANPECYSNVITLPAPPGYGASGFDAWVARAKTEARSIIESHYPAFVEKCRAAFDPQVGTIGRSKPDYLSNEIDANGPVLGRRTVNDVQVQMP